MPGQNATNYDWLTKALPICTSLQAKVLNTIMRTGEIKLAAKELGMSEAAVSKTFFRVRKKYDDSHLPTRHKSQAEHLLRRAGMNPKWLAEQKRALIISDKPSMAALKAINDCEEVFGLKQPAGPGINIDTGPKIIINLGSGFDSLKTGGTQQTENGEGSIHSTVEAANGDVPAPDKI